MTTTMHGDKLVECPSLEMLAAFVDRRLDASEEALVGDHLDACERCHEVVVETMLFKEEETAAGSPSVVAHPRAAWAPRPGQLAASLAAAAVLVVAGVVAFLSSSRAPFDGVVLVRTITRSGSATDLVENTYTGHGWPQVRGRSPVVSPNARAFRLGVRTIDFEVALAAGRVEEAEARLREILSLAEYMDNLKLTSYEALLAELAAGEVVTSASRRNRESARIMRRATVPPHYDLGQWVELGRLAASIGDRAYFRRRSVLRFVEFAMDADLEQVVTEHLLTAEEKMHSDLDNDDLRDLEETLTRLAAAAGTSSGRR